MWPLLLLAVLAAAQGAQYGDYGAVKMPAYGDYDPREAAVDDYRRPAASAMDYKDEEDGKGNTDKPLNKEYRNDDSWQKPVRKQSKRIRDEEYSEVSNGRSKNRAGHNRPSDDRPTADDKTRDFHARSHKRRDDGEDEFSIEKYIQGINENNLEVDASQAKSRTTDRIIRRKPRDRDNPSDAAVFKETDFEEEALPPAPQPGRAPPAPAAPRDADFRQDDLRSGEKSDDIGDKGLMRGMLPVEKRVRVETDEMGPRRRPNAPYASEGESAGAPRLRPAQRARLDPGSSEYDTEYYDVKRMRNMRRRPSSDRRPEDAYVSEPAATTSMSVVSDVSVASVAEEQLGRMLASRQRKEIAEPTPFTVAGEAPANVPPPPPNPLVAMNALNPLLNRAWTDFLAANRALRGGPSAWLLAFLALINVAKI